MANYDEQVANLQGVALAYHAAAAGGDDITVGDNEVLLVRNASAGSVNATIVTPGSQQGLAVADLVVPCPVGDTAIGPIGPALFRDQTTHRAHVTFSAQAGVTFAVVAVVPLD